MKIGFLITARLKSSRLKLKLLKQLNSKTVIEHVITRAKKVVECEDIGLTRLMGRLNARVDQGYSL